MAFVYEKISESDREWINSFGIISMSTGEPIMTPYWAIDREREVFLVSIGGGQGFYTSEAPQYFAMVWGKNLIKLATFSEGDGKISSGVKMRWKITQIDAPESLLNVKGELIELIKEAIGALGIAGRNCVSKTDFEYIASPRFIREVKK